MAKGALIEEVIEEVADNLEEAAEVTRRIDSRGVGFFLGGVCVGAAVGFFFGYRFNREKIKAEAFRESEEEVDKIRQTYQQKTIAAEPKPSVDEIIAERGYSVKTEVVERPLPAPVPIIEVPIVVDTGHSKNDGWDYTKEIANRSPEHPYIIHQDEFSSRELGYGQVSYSYYNADDVLCDEDDTPLPHADIIVGRNNLKFGHGSDDEGIVFVRNDKLQLDMEIAKNPGSYEQDVLGLDNIQHSDRRRPKKKHR